MQISKYFEVVWHICTFCKGTDKVEVIKYQFIVSLCRNDDLVIFHEHYLLH